MSTSITSSITEGQKEQFRRLVEDAATKACDLTLQQVPLDKDGLQKLISSRDQFNAAVARRIIIETRAIAVSNRLENEEVESTFGYLSGNLSGYKHFGSQAVSAYKPKGITAQTNCSSTRSTTPAQKLAQRRASFRSSRRLNPLNARAFDSSCLELLHLREYFYRAVHYLS